MTTKYLPVLAFFLVLAAIAPPGTVARTAGPAPAELSRFAYTEPHMGTRFRIVLYALDQRAADQASRAAFDRVHYLDEMMTDYKDTSELMHLCQNGGGPAVVVSPELFFVLAKAQAVSKMSDGAFDVTVGPIVRLWRRARRQKELPDPKKLAAALELVGWEKIVLEEKYHSVELLKPGMLLDLGGIAKGYAADEALAAMRKHGIASALVAAGGDISVMGSPPKTSGWSIGIAPLESPNLPPSRYLILQDAAVSTSGDAEQYVEIGGKRYSHIVDPKTGMGLTGHRSVTVVARKGIDADSLTKVVSVLGAERGMPIIDGIEGAAALSLEKTEQGTVTAESKRWKDVPQKTDKATKD
jgi:FAD:protein FMN transferase